MYRWDSCLIFNSYISFKNGTNPPNTSSEAHYTILMSLHEILSLMIKNMTDARFCQLSAMLPWHSNIMYSSTYLNMWYWPHLHCYRSHSFHHKAIFWVCSDCCCIWTGQRDMCGCLQRVHSQWPASQIDTAHTAYSKPHLEAVWVNTIDILAILLTKMYKCYIFKDSI